MSASVEINLIGDAGSVYDHGSNTPNEPVGQQNLRIAMGMGTMRTARNTGPFHMKERGSASERNK